MGLDKFISIAVAVGVMWSQSVQAQQLNSAQREVWQTVETRWRAWQAGDLDKMLILYHSRFHAWNRVTGRLDGHDAMLARWKTALQSEKILAVNLQPIAVEVYGEFAAVFYVSRETVKVTSGAGNEEGGLPNVVAIRWSDYLVREKGRWLFVGYNGVPCSQSEPADSPCRLSLEK